MPGHRLFDGVGVGQGVVVLVGLAGDVGRLEGRLPVRVDLFAFLRALVAVGLGLEEGEPFRLEDGDVGHDAFTEGLGVLAGVGLVIGVLGGGLEEKLGARLVEGVDGLVLLPGAGGGGLADLFGGVHGGLVVGMDYRTSSALSRMVSASLRVPFISSAFS